MGTQQGITATGTAPDLTLGLTRALTLGLEMGRSPAWVRIAATIATGLALTGCDAASPAPDRPHDAPLPGGDTEAPEDFHVTEAGIWDGRPSLGGAWVAHPSVTAPGRAIIRNTENGATTTGALLRRTSGTGLQISSDAASDLGMPPGDPAVLDVTALRAPAQPVDIPGPPEIPGIPDLTDDQLDGLVDETEPTRARTDLMSLAAAPLPFAQR
ncbi:hypothetical protein [Chachezhania sediminis]|uniref:hypothetical protein n=1 Tax=Chachezhania sediminis TaxID=2599291 RepID=UPI00131ABB99|nr:hypothetical protein [Chachezhania sediminis]